jgi:calcineurin-like phosphoesterase family protein
MDPWLISDTHLGHIKHIERPEGFSEKIIKNLKNVLKNDSILIHLGDVSFGDDESWNNQLTSLLGKKWLILGNHDNRTLSWYASHGWDFVGESMSLKIFGKHILFSHIPMITDASFMDSKGNFLRYSYDMNIHGHFHNFGAEKVKKKEPEIYKILNKKHYLVCLENLNYQPIKLKRIVELFNAGKISSII